MVVDNVPVETQGRKNDGKNKIKSMKKKKVCKNTFSITPFNGVLLRNKRLLDRRPNRRLCVSFLTKCIEREEKRDRIMTAESKRKTVSKENRKRLKNVGPIAE